MTEKVLTGGNVEFVYPNNFNPDKLSERERKEFQELYNKGLMNQRQRQEDLRQELIKKKVEDKAFFEEYEKRAKRRELWNNSKPYIIGFIVIVIFTLLAKWLVPKLFF